MTGVASSAEVQQNWGSLPREILVEILQKLQWNERLFTAPLVCHCWYDASRDPLCWKHLDFQDWDMKYWRVSENASSIFEVGIDFAKLLKILLKLANNQVTSISFPILATTNFELLYVSDRCPELTFLSLGKFNLLLKDIHAAVSKLRALGTLHLSHNLTRFGEKDVKLKYLICQIGVCCEDMRELMLISFDLSEEDASAIASSCPCLKSLILRFGYLEKDWLERIMKGCIGLERLYLVGCRGLEMDHEMQLYCTSRLKDFYWAPLLDNINDDDVNDHESDPLIGGDTDDFL